LGVTLAVFLLIHLVPGNPAAIALGPRATPASIHQLEQQWGLTESLPQQFVNFLGRLGTGNLGTSITYDRPVTSLISARLPITIWLVLYAAVLVVLIATPLALWSAAHPDKRSGTAVRLLSVAGLGLPTFWVGLILINLLAVNAHLFPAAGWGSGVLGHLHSLFLPALVIAVSLVPLVLRSLRAEMMKVAQADYVQTARAKGLPERVVRQRHVLRNALVPAVAVLTVNVGFLIGGTLVVENVFGLPGLGQLMLQGIKARDFAVVQGVTLVFAIGVILVTVVSDVVTSLLDKRIELR
jgi:peptide/nickel transport system permease protein